MTIGGIILLVTWYVLDKILSGYLGAVGSDLHYLSIQSVTNVIIPSLQIVGNCVL
jgi:hypothetical protein